MAFETEAPRTASTGSTVVRLGVMILVGYAVFVVIMMCFTPYLEKAAHSYDNSEYLWVAGAIRTHNFTPLYPRVFWGFSYFIALFGWLLHINNVTAMLLISTGSGLLSTILVWSLWGETVAGFFALANFAWIRLTLLGGSETVCVLMLLIAFWCVRRELWQVAAGSAAVATVVRPIGIFGLLAVGLVLLARKQYKEFALATLIGLAVGTAYVIPLIRLYGDPLVNYHHYTPDWGGSAYPVSVPMLPVILGFIRFGKTVPWTNNALSLIWVLFTVATVYRLLRTKRPVTWPVEWLFGIMYGVFLLSYNSPFWTRAEICRFAVPLLPVGLGAFRPYADRFRKIIPVLSVSSPILAAMSALNLRNTLSILLGR